MNEKAHDDGDASEDMSYTSSVSSDYDETNFISIELIEQQRMKLAQKGGSKTGPERRSEPTAPGAFDSLGNSRKSPAYDQRRAVGEDEDATSSAAAGEGRTGIAVDQGGGEFVPLEATAVDEDADIEALRQTMEIDKATLIAEMRNQSLRLQEEMEKKHKRQRRLYMYAIIIVIMIAAVVGTTVALVGNGDNSTQMASEISNDSATNEPNDGSSLPCSDFDESLYDTPHCQQIAVGATLKFQGDMMLRKFSLEMDVSVTNDDVDLCELQTKIQGYLMPQLAECATLSNRRQLQGGPNGPDSDKEAIGNGVVSDIEVQESSSCEAGATAPCFRVAVELDIYIRREPEESLINVISAVFGAGESLTLPLHLSDEYVDVALTSITPTTASNRSSNYHSVTGIPSNLRT